MGNVNMNYSCNGVQATVWDNINEDRIFRSVNFKRRYKDKDGNWQDSDSFNMQDLMSLKTIIDKILLKYAVKERLPKEKKETTSEPEETPAIEAEVVNEADVPF